MKRPISLCMRSDLLSLRPLHTLDRYMQQTPLMKIIISIVLFLFLLGCDNTHKVEQKDSIWNDTLMIQEIAGLNLSLIESVLKYQSKIQPSDTSLWKSINTAAVIAQKNSATKIIGSDESLSKIKTKLISNYSITVDELIKPSLDPIIAFKDELVELENFKIIRELKVANQPNIDLRMKLLVMNEIFYNKVMLTVYNFKIYAETQTSLLGPLVHKVKELPNGKREIFFFITSNLESDFEQTNIVIGDNVYTKDDLLKDSLYYDAIKHVMHPNDQSDSITINVQTRSKFTGVMHSLANKFSARQ